ncbi:PREDICTED: isocitrate dehydrogenase [NAD] subunit beta, mitochondrial-like [Priapulus caudatus]|uniref:Isocitrate dehydrogenase [NAD] subunit, mitochondrial n=1 Tax=Priapulus caudatus TaxID=37621 RepID=A0ABM1EKB3_PRICU|nr:PREDICTED: isocitrate dehydrogenase [NAD] subunit beta, mitochondrial-like [Priapulus caudatus]
MALTAAGRLSIFSMFRLHRSLQRAPPLTRCLLAPLSAQQDVGSRRSAGGVSTVTMIPGDGVGPELMTSVKTVFKNIGVPIQFEQVFISELHSKESATVAEVVSSIQRNGVCLKGIISTPHGVGGELQTINMKFRRALNLFANVVHVQSIPGVATRHEALDFVVIREQLEGEYSALEHESVPGVVECLKIITRANSERIAKFAFDYAVKNGRSKVTAVHKANIMKLGDGLFLESCANVAPLYPSIKFESMIIDNCCMQLVSDPYQFDVMVMPNLYGNIVDNLAAGLVGGAGIVPGENYSPEYGIFEPGARHPFAHAVGRNVANPTAILLASSKLLSYMKLNSYADAIRSAVFDVIKAKKVRTKDLGGHATTSEFTIAVLNAIKF